MVPQPDAVPFRILEHRKRTHSVDIGWRHDNGRAAAFGSGNGSIQVIHCDVNRQIGTLIFINLMNATVNPHTRFGANGSDRSGLINIPAKHCAVELPQFGGVPSANLEMDNWIGHI